VHDAAGASSSADELAKLADLRDRGVITEAEFQQGKAKILA
jgi:putative oligomerization/nucleic acid binding protein